jgi:hypothetical protein
MMQEQSVFKEKEERNEARWLGVRAQPPQLLKSKDIEEEEHLSGLRNLTPSNSYSVGGDLGLKFYR